jgi:predicted nucleic acid-binding protein
VTRFVIDAGVAIHLAMDGARVANGHLLLAPTLIRSQVLSRLHEAVAAGELGPQAARANLEHIGRMPIRLLGDAVLRRRAWDIADQLGWPSTYDAEYVALTQLQADALVTLDNALAARVGGLVRIAGYEELLR